MQHAKRVTYPRATARSQKIVEQNASHRYRSLALTMVFVLTMFVSAVLLFLVEPMFAKMALPLLGGTPQVWNTAVVFYQLVLLIGYLYAHIGAARLGVRRQAALHMLLLLLPFLVLPIALPAAWIPPAEANPIPWLLALLTVSVGLPFFVVSASSPLLQSWFSSLDHPAASDPYFLYAASNLGSMLGLLSYPFLLEPTLRLKEQSSLWALGYGLLVACMLVCAGIAWHSRQCFDTTGQRPALIARRDGEVTNPRRLRWIVWAFIPSSLMLSVTTYLSTDIAAVPLLWIIPLALYLLSFVLAFARKPILQHHNVTRAFRLMLLFILYIFFLAITHIVLAPFHLLAFFVVAWACHSALAEDRPQPKHLTEFYLWIAVGGALGGMFNTLLAPVLFDSVPEYPLVLALAALAFVRRGDISSQPRTRRLDLALPLAVAIVVAGGLVALQAMSVGADFRVRAAVFAVLPLVMLRLSRRRIRFALGVAALVLVSFLVPAIPRLWSADRQVYAERGFFGVHRVEYTESDGERYHVLFHGTTLHGMQALDPARRRDPLTYYHRTGPIGQVFDAMNEQQRLHQVAVVGLGIGSLACYSQAGQQWTYYEIDPLVVRIAQDERFFTGLRDCAPTARIVLGDGRLSLARADDGQYDLIVLDAYSSDSIPLHLLSRESLALYLQKLAPHGLLAYHISNRYMEIRPVLADLALDAGLVSLAQFDQDVSAEQARLGKRVSEWVIMGRTAEDLGRLAGDARWQRAEGQPGRAVWTDDFSSVVAVLRLW